MKILVAMSGGVDSTISAYLLKKAGHEVVGVNFNFINLKAKSADEPFLEVGTFNSPELEEIADKLNIKIIYKDFAQDFHDTIIKYFVNEYECGRTPNPCALCNATMKFDKLLKVMKEENCDMIATGHYANVGSRSSRYYIKKSSNQQKDQSYMLYRLTQEQLSHIIFPLADMDKADVRKIAAELGLKVADKKDSQDVCFIDNSKPVGASCASPINYKEFIKRYEFGPNYREKIARGELKEEDILSKPYFKKGEFVDLYGNVLGFHTGIINYTVGQRKGLNIAFGERKFVVRIDADKNQVVLGSNDDLMSTEFKIRDIVFSGHDENVVGKKFYAKLRYRHDGTLCEITASDKACEDELTYRRGELCESKQLILTCRLDSPVRAITPGQSAVFYDEEGCVMLGGIIL